MLVALASLVLALVPPPIDPPGAGANGGSSDTPPPAVLVGARSVTTRDVSGGIRRLTSVPSSSLFGSLGGGAAGSCSFTADRDGFVLSDGSRVAKGTVVTSTFHFVEGLAIAFDLPPVVLPDDVLQVPSSGSLVEAVRTFTVFCDRSFYDVNYWGIVQVPVTDPLLDPRVRFDDLLNDLQLIEPVVFENPVVDVYGGLVTRYPVWLAIDPGAWHTQRSSTVTYRGSTLAVIAQPRELEFVVDFVPNPDKPSPAFRGIIGCVPAVAAVGDGVAMPGLPVLADQSEPGPNGPCMWTPPGPGQVTITARVTYTITFWVSGYTEAEPDYTWTGPPVTYPTGELIAVNTNPTP